uniref:Uncharacterized protein n=1 Tax=Setaria viridis TaxID=4556 RepID=A0A4U6TQH0_SETVI|nr:hypothetical protein SEVIR_7G032858v2 [Setaria viridis]
MRWPVLLRRRRTRRGKANRSSDVPRFHLVACKGWTPRGKGNPPAPLFAASIFPLLIMG